MWTSAKAIALLEFERDRYHATLERLKEELNVIANDMEEQRFNLLWMIPCDALDRDKVAVAAAEAGLFTSLVDADASY